jgi:serine/threonine protein kinase
MTQAGVILGTAASMSPEQEEGRDADKRSDIWAFGCVVFEMLTGVRAFTGHDVSDTLVAVLRDEPDWEAIPSDAPAWRADGAIVYSLAHGAAVQRRTDGDCWRYGQLTAARRPAIFIAVPL